MFGAPGIMFEAQGIAYLVKRTKLIAVALSPIQWVKYSVRWIQNCMLCILQLVHFRMGD
jgi:hypothetical protein